MEFLTRSGEVPPGPEADCASANERYALRLCAMLVR